MANPYANASTSEHDVTDLMRRINALQATAGATCLPVKKLWPCGTFGTPTSMAVDSSGNVYLSSHSSAFGLEKWSAQGFRLWRVDDVNGETNLFVCCDQDDNPWVISTDPTMMSVDATDGSYISTFSGAPATANNAPAFDSSGNCYHFALTTVGGLTWSIDVYKYDSGGSLVTSWNVASKAISGANYYGRMSIDISSADVLWIAYSETLGTNGAIVKSYSTSGVAGTTISGSGDGDGGFAFASLSTSLSATPHSDGYIYTTSDGRIQRFNSSGTFQEKYGRNTSGMVPVIEKESFYPTFIRGRNGYLWCLTNYGPVLVGEQTPWVAYKESSIVSLGTPDDGVAVPTLNGLYQNAAIFTPAHLADLRFAVEALSYLSVYHFFTVPITSATNASPIVVTLSNPINVVNNNFVRIYGARGNTAANGSYQVDNVNGAKTQFELQGTTGNGTYVANTALCSLSLNSLFQYANINRATDYGASDVSHGWWTREIDKMTGPNVVVGSDGNDYECYASVNQGYTADDYTPITGADYADAFYSLGTTGNGRTFKDKYRYSQGRSVVEASNGNAFGCIEDHFSTADTAPITGADYADYWEDLGIVAGGLTPAHTIGTAYSCDKAYDIDIGEIANCVAYLEDNP